ncbi:MAG: FAD:protein FMN transferase [Deltaproteobacteria bacterium]|nr:FAD:protein FMN transferase [Deltaproteobacteria bacterium]
MRSGSAGAILLALICVSTLPLSPARAAPPTQPRLVSETIMATRIEVQFAGDSGTAEDAEAVLAIFRRVDALASEWKPGSPLALLNAQSGAAVSVPAELTELLARSLDLAQRTDGAFDPTWAALWGLWDFRAEAPAVPAAEEIAARVGRIDWRALELDPDEAMAKLGPNQVAGLGGIAKGWALDSAAELLHERSVTDWVLTAGGQVLADGVNSDGTPWTVGIRDPRGESTDFFALVRASGLSVSTSGDYERFFEVDGVRYHHILDPRTGLPARGLRSVTVVSASATTADALSTALMVMGYAKGSALVGSMDGVDAVWVDEAGGVVISPGLAARFSLVHAPRNPPRPTPPSTP